MKYKDTSEKEHTERRQHTDPDGAEALGITGHEEKREHTENFNREQKFCDWPCAVTKQWQQNIENAKDCECRRAVGQNTLLRHDVHDRHDCGDDTEHSICSNQEYLVLIDIVH